MPINCAERWKSDSEPSKKLFEESSEGKDVSYFFKCIGDKIVAGTIAYYRSSLSEE